MRIAKIKETMAPTIWKVKSTTDELTLSIQQAHPNYPIDGFGEIMSFIWVTKSCRNYALKHIAPKRIIISSEVSYREKIEKDLGCDIEIGPRNALVFDTETASLPLVSKCDFLAASVDVEISKRLSNLASYESSLTNITEELIKHILASGNVTAERVANDLAISKRTFERRLNSEGTNFRNLLEKCKAELSLKYIENRNYSASEVSFMLGFKEPNSFFRAFKKWHGKTPKQFKQSLNEASSTNMN